MKTYITLIILFFCSIVYGQETGDLRFNNDKGRIEIYIEEIIQSYVWGDTVHTKKMEGWYSVDSLYQEHGNSIITTWSVISIGTIINERERFNIYAEEWLHKNLSEHNNLTKPSYRTFTWDNITQRYWEDPPKETTSNKKADWHPKPFIGKFNNPANEDPLKKIFLVYLLETLKEYEKKCADSILIGYKYKKKTSENSELSWCRYFEYYLAKEVDANFADGMTWEKFIRYRKEPERPNYDTKTPIYYHYPLSIESFIKFLDKKIKLSK